MVCDPCCQQTATQTTTPNRYFRPTVHLWRCPEPQHCKQQEEVTIGANLQPMHERTCGRQCVTIRVRLVQIVRTFTLSLTMARISTETKPMSNPQRSVSEQHGASPNHRPLDHITTMNTMKAQQIPLHLPAMSLTHIGLETDPTLLTLDFSQLPLNAVKLLLFTAQSPQTLPIHVQRGHPGHRILHWTGSAACSSHEEGSALD
jgi:hypothetical protein